MAMSDFTARRSTFRRLHESGCFVIPNPWDIGSARYLRHLGFQALATTSAGFAFSRGLADAAVPRDAMLTNIAEIVGAVDSHPYRLAAFPAAQVVVVGVVTRLAASAFAEQPPDDPAEHW